MFRHNKYFPMETKTNRKVVPFIPFIPFVAEIEPRKQLRP